MHRRLVSIVLLVVAGLVAPALAQPTRITTSPLNDSGPVWHPGGETIAYLKTDDSNNLQIGGVNSDGTTERQMAAGPGDGGAYLGYGFELYWVGNSTDLVTHERMIFHEWLAFDTTQEPFTRVLFDGSDTANTRKMSVQGGRAGGPLRVSRNGLTALWRDSDNFSTTSLRTADYATLTGQISATHGSRVLSLPESPHRIQRGLALSPDGSKYVVALPSDPAVHAGGHDLYLGDTAVDGTRADLTALTTTGASDDLDNYAPAFSPNGQQLLFARGIENTPGSFDLFMIDVDGTNLVQVTNTPGVDEGSPSWAPDGLRYVYARLDAGIPEGDNWNLYVDTLSTQVPAARSGGLIILIVFFSVILGYMLFARRRLSAR